MDGESLRAYIEQCLVPAMQQGDIVVMHNLANHKVAGMKALTKTKGEAGLFRWSRRRARSSSPRKGWVLGVPFLTRRT